MVKGSVLQDRQALIHLFRSTDGESWRKRDGWASHDGMSGWFGVTTNAEGRVVRLKLPSNNLCGGLPQELGDLSAVITVDLSGNYLTGPVPNELGNLLTVRTLDLSENQLTEGIPTTLGDLSASKTLDVSSNRLTGNIPAELGNLPAVERLDPSSNLPTGAIPKELGDLPAVKRLDLSSNELTASSTTTRGVPNKCTANNDLDVDITHLAPAGLLGVLYTPWAVLEDLCVFDETPARTNDLGRGDLSGEEIPKALGGLRRLEHLVLTDNHLGGEIPKELGNLPSLEVLGLGDNQLSGRIPYELGHLPSVTALQLSSNHLSEVPLELLEVLRKRNMFSILDVYRNPLLRPPQTEIEIGADHAIAWWEDIRRFGVDTSNKLKMVLVGLAEAGKTTVVRNITGRSTAKTLDRTVGIEITDGWKPVDGGPLEVSIWDFAGQADYYASHQIFLTKGSLFLLVVDLQALVTETTDGVGNDGDPHGRVYRWLEMLHLRVPGAAVALVGTHTDAAEFTGPVELENGVSRLEQLVARYRKDKAKEARTVESRRPLRAPQPLFIHDKVFRTSLSRESTKELVRWVGKAATLRECPEGFRFPAVGATVPIVWMDAISAMDSLTVGKYGKRYVTWREAVQTFTNFMETKSILLPDAEETLKRAMRHREAEGGVILSLDHDPTRLAVSPGMLYLDPTWLIEVIRRLTDHSLVDPAREGALKLELDLYREEVTPGLTLDMLWAQHRSYRKSGTLDLAYLRFLLLHRHLDNGLKLNLDGDEFNGVLETMVNLLVMYRAPTMEGSHRDLYVVPARFPEYGDENVLQNGNIGLGDAVVRVTCSFRQSYSPPGLIGRFLAFANAHIREARECWQHGAHLVWAPGCHDILVYETQCVERIDSGSVTYPGLVLCVKGSTPAVREVLDSLTEEVRSLFGDKVHGYPGLCSECFGDTEVVRVSDLSSDLCKYLENRFDRLESQVEGVSRVTGEVLQGLYLAAEKDNQYPRLFILKPEFAAETNAGLGKSSTPVHYVPKCAEGELETDVAAAPECMQRETWNGWIHALTERRKCRMVFVCEHDMTEVRCGPHGNGYLIEDLPAWVKGCLPLLQVTLYTLRVIGATVLHVDLPLDDLLAAVVKSAATELLGDMGSSISVLGLALPTPIPNESTGVDELQQLKRMQEDSYSSLCQFMQGLEMPSSSCCGLRFRCSGCGSARRADCACVVWRDGMVRVGNGKGGLVWVKKTNEAAYKRKIDREAEGSRTAQYA